VTFEEEWAKFRTEAQLDEKFSPAAVKCCLLAFGFGASVVLKAQVKKEGSLDDLLEQIGQFYRQHVDHSATWATPD
jgi:hypothetical protein